MSFIFSLFSMLGAIMVLLVPSTLKYKLLSLDVSMAKFGLLVMVIGLIGLFLDRIFGRTRIDRRTNRINRQP